MNFLWFLILACCCNHNNAGTCPGNAERSGCCKTSTRSCECDNFNDCDTSSDSQPRSACPSQNQTGFDNEASCGCQRCN